KTYDHIVRHEHTSSHSHRTPWTSHKISEEAGGNDHRAGSNHGDGDRVEKLAIGEPVVLLNDSAVEKWNNGEAAAENERARLSKKPEQLWDLAAHGDSGAGESQQRGDLRLWCSHPGSFRKLRNRAPQQEQPDDLASGDGG